MNAKRTRFHMGLPVIETDFFQAGKWLIDLGRTSENPPRLVLVLYWGDGTNCQARPAFVHKKDHVLLPPNEDEITRHVRFPKSLTTYGTVGELLREVEAFLAQCLDLEEQYRFLLACFVLSTWVVDRLPVAPYVALVGLPRSGKTTALSVLYLLCRRGLMTSDISSAAFYRACDRLMPTLCIDETATAGQKRTLFHLLRAGTTQGSVAFREGQSYRSYGAKVLTWAEMPDDGALNSRCVAIPMHETLRTDLLRTTDPKIIAAADKLQSRLQLYRFQHYDTLKLQRIPGDERPRGRDRDLYEALALPISEDPEACARLLECLEHQQDLNREPLPPNQVAVLESLFKQIHVQPDQEAFPLRLLTNEANSNLAALGERFRLNERTVSGMLKTFVFLRRKRTNSGWVVLIDRAARQRIHEQFSLHGMNGLSSCLPAQAPEECEFCKPQDVAGKEHPSNGTAGTTVASEPKAQRERPPNGNERSEHSERRAHENEPSESLFSNKFIDGPDDEALIENFKRYEPADESL